MPTGASAARTGSMPAAGKSNAESSSALKNRNRKVALQVRGLDRTG